MRGFVTTRDVLLHPVSIVQAFGLRTYLRCCGRLLSRHPVTFLECIAMTYG
jgi:hypothetical protein